MAVAIKRSPNPLIRFADRCEVARGLDVLFEGGHLFAADDDAGDGLAEMELQKVGGGGAARQSFLSFVFKPIGYARMCRFGGPLDPTSQF